MPLSRSARPGFWVRNLYATANRLARRKAGAPGFARGGGPFVKAAAVAVAAWGLSGSAARAATYEWDVVPGGGVTGGTGAWNTTVTNWTTDGGTSNVAWGNTTADVAVFGAPGGTVTVTTVNAGGLTFNASGYNVTGSTITLGAASTLAVTNAADSATIASALAGGGALATDTAFTKTGAGTLFLTGTNTFVGNVVVSAGTLSVTAGNANAALGANGTNDNLLIVDGGTFQLTGGATYNPAGAEEAFRVGAAGGTFDIAAATTLQLDDAGQFGNAPGVATAGTLTKTGAGTLFLDNQGFNFNGGLTINGGTVRIDRNAGVLGTSAATVAPITIAAGATYDIRVTQTSQRPITVSGGSIVNGATTNAVTLNAVTLAGDATFGGVGTLTVPSLDLGGGARTITKTGTGNTFVNGTAANVAGVTTVSVTTGGLYSGTAASLGADVAVTTTGAAATYSQNGAASAASTYTVGAGSTLSGDTAFFNSLTTTNTTFAAGAAFAETAAGQNATIATTFGFANDASRFFGVAATITDTVTVGTGTPWAGISNDRQSRTFNATVTANSDFTIRVNGATFILGNSAIAPAVAGTPVKATVTGGTLQLNDTTGGYTSDLTFEVASGATLQTVSAPSLGSSATPALNAKVNVLSGAVLNPNGGATLNGNVTIQPGGRLNLDDGTNLTGSGTITQFPGSITNITTGAALAGAQSAGTVPGSIVRMEQNSIASVPTKIDNAAIFVFNANRVLLNATPPTATPTAIALNSAGTVTIGGVTVPTGVLTNDGTSRNLAIADTNTNGQTALSTITIGANGATFAATTGTTLSLQRNLQAGDGTGGINVLGVGNPLTIGIAGVTNIDGQTGKAGTVLYGGGSAASLQVGSLTIAAGTFQHNGGGAQFQVGGSGTLDDGSGVGLITANSGTTFVSVTGIRIDGQLNLLAGSTGRFQITAGADNTVAGQVVSGLQGAGNLFLGGTSGTNRDVNLSVGANNLNSTFSGVIANTAAANRGALTKVGTGTLTLTGNNTYTLGTTITAGTLQLGNGGTAGSIAGPIVNNAALVIDRSNNVTLAGALTGTGTLTKLGAGIATLSGTPNFTGSATVSAGTLAVAAAGTFTGAGGVTVTSGGRFDFTPAANGTLTVGSLTLAGNSTLGVVLGSNVASTGSASATGANTVVASGSGAAGTYTLATAPSGFTSGGATYSFVFLNPVNYTATGSATDAALSVTTTAATPLTTFYWKGGFANNVFSASDGVSTSNFTTDAAGTTNTPLTPGPTATVNYSATGATGQGSQTLGANVSVLALVTTDTAPVVVNPDGNTLTLAQATAASNAILLSAGAASLTIGSNVTAGGSQTWTNNSTTGAVLTVGSAGASTIATGANTVTVAGPGATTIAGNLSGATGVLTRTGTGTLTLGGTTNALKQLNLNSTGVVDIGAGTLTLSNTGTDTLQSNVTSGTVTINATGGGKLAFNVNNTNGPDNGVANGGTLLINAQVTGTSTFEFFRSGVTTGVIVLANPLNDFTGGVVLNTGIISTATIGNTGAVSGLGTGNNIYFGGGALRYTGTGETSNKIINLNTATGNGTIEQAGTGNLLFTANLATPGAGIKTLTLTGSTAGTGEIAGVISNNSATNTTGVTKTGSGTWTLSGANTYTGATTVSAGTLLINGTNSTGTVSVAAPAVLGGRGSVAGAVTVTGTLRAGTGVGTASAGGTFTNSSTTTFNAGSTLGVVLTGGAGNATNANTGTGFSSGVTPTTPTFNNYLLASGTGTLSFASTMTIAVDGSNAGLVEGQFYSYAVAQQASGSTLTLPSTPTFNTFGFTSSDINLSTSGGVAYLNFTATTVAPIPEPGMVFGLAAGGFGLVNFVRRRRAGKETG